MIRCLAPVFACFTLPALADAPRVVADIGPVHSMVARVMEGVGAPTLLVPTNTSPHGYAMRPSEADALSKADAVFWVGASLAPWVERAVDSLAQDALSVELLVDAGVAPLPEGGASVEKDHDHDASHDHGDAHDDHEDHADHGDDHAGDHSDDHGDHDGDDHADHDGDDHADHDGHDHGGVDPHAWLDPATGKLWLDLIADTLAELDPENAIIYAANAEAGRAELDSLMIEIRDRVAPLKGRGYITFHDAYHWFETRFDLPAQGSISVSDATPASAGRVAALREVITTSEATCIFSEPQFDPGLAEILADGTSAHTGVLDPLGATLQPGTELYPALLRNLSLSLEDCLTR